MSDYICLKKDRKKPSGLQRVLKIESDIILEEMKS